MAAKESDKYKIPLDAVDINFLSMNFKSKYDFAPLWLGNNMKNDYYEFEVRNIDDDKEDEIPNIICHMCNIEVPEPYLKQHHDSFKHRINMKIADTALERLKKNMHNYNYCNEQANTSLHFCPTCVAVIRKKDKLKHEKSVAHKYSILADKYLHDFYIFYTNDDKENDLGNDVHLKTDKPENNLSCDIEFLSAKSEIDCDNDSSIILKDMNNIISDVTSENNHDDTHDSSENLNDNKAVEFTNNTNNKVSKKNKKQKAKTSEEKNSSETLQVENIINDKSIEPIVEIEFGDKSEETVKINKSKLNKQKSKSKDNNVEINKNATLSAENKETENKSENIIEEIKDGAKKVPKVIKTTPNARINYIIHSIKPVDQENGVICKICDNNNEDHSCCNYLIKAITDFSDLPNIWKTIKEQHYHLVIRSETPFCLVCKINCLFVNVIEHLFSNNHFSQYEKLVEDNFLISDDVHTTCQACNVKVKKELELLHCEDMTHITRQEMHKKKLKK